MTLLLMQLETEQEERSVHHTKLGRVVVKFDEAFPVDGLLQVAPLHLFVVCLDLGLTLLVKQLLLREVSHAFELTVVVGGH